MSLSDSEVVVLGYNAAGWFALEASERSKGKKVFGFGDPPIKPDNSYYDKHHTGKEISDSKKDFLKSVAANELVQNIDITLNTTEKNALIKIYNSISDLIYLDDYVSDVTEKETLKSVLANANISAHQFFWLIASSLEKPQHLDMATAEEITNMKGTINTTIEKVNEKCNHSQERYDEIRTNDYSGLQTTMWASKRIIADTFQENVRRHYAKEPLIPLMITIGTEKTSFSPDIKDMKDKNDGFVTPTEIRMIYKLMEELPNDELKEIMRETVSFFKEQSNGSFEKTESPWASLSWEDRPRGQRGETKEPYFKRESLPKWINDIITTKGVGPETLDSNHAEIADDKLETFQKLRP